MSVFNIKDSDVPQNPNIVGSQVVYHDLLDEYTLKTFLVLVEETFLPRGVPAYCTKFDANLMYEMNSVDRVKARLPANLISKALAQNRFLKFLRPRDAEYFCSLTESVIRLLEQHMDNIKEKLPELITYLEEARVAVVKIKPSSEINKRKAIRENRQFVPLPSFKNFLDKLDK